ncbi:MAG: nucleotidyltransferase domain-containing protein, partial [Bacteroidales bacterium]|nr:nucleotidyltransferase domain-containing protein [Bacteroidales bacterium]
DMEVQTPDFKETEWMQSADIVVDENVEGTIHVCYNQLIRMQGGSQFLPQEQKLLNTIADKMEFDQFGVKGLYICGSTKNADAGPGSDIDLIVHQQGTDLQQRELIAWLQGWGLCLSEVNYSRTGYRVDESLIDLHIVNDEDMKKKTSFAAMIGSCHNLARPLKVKEK